MKRAWAVLVLLLLTAGLLVPPVTAQGPTPSGGEASSHIPPQSDLPPPTGHGEWLSRGEPISVPTNRGTTEVVQPGVYRYESGLPDQLGILLCSDSCFLAPPHTCAEVALQNLGHSYTLYYSDWAGCETALGTGAYDAVLIDNACMGPAASLFDALDTFLVNGGLAMINTYNMDAFPAHPLWATAGVAFAADMTDSAPPVYRWAPNHPAVDNWPADPLQFNNLYIDDGDSFDALPNAQLPAGYTAAPTAGQGAFAVRDDGNAMVAGFCIDNLATLDQDENGVSDCVEVWRDGAGFLLRSINLEGSFKEAPPHVMRGDPITYTVVIETSGSEPPPYVVMSDTVPVGTSFISGSLACSSGTCWYDPADNAVHWQGIAGDQAAVVPGHGEWLSRGDPISVPTNRGTTEVVQPGVYRYESGLPEQLDILLCSDSGRVAPPNTCAEVALQNLGHSYTLYYQDWAGCEAALSGAYDAVLIDNALFFPTASLFDALDTFLAGGGMAMINTFDMDAFPAHPLWARAGVAWATDKTASPPPPVYRWAPNHPAVNNWPADPLQFDNWYADDGDSFDTLPNAQPLAGYLQQVHRGNPAYAVRGDDRAMVVGFCIDNLAGLDQDGNGVSDCVEVWQDGAGFFLMPKITFAVDSTYAYCEVVNRAIIEDPKTQERVVASAATQVWNTFYFYDDFEAGYGNWSMNGLWNPEQEGDACGALVAPFPSSESDTYYGIDGVCNYDTPGAPNSGVLTMSLDVDLSNVPAAYLQFWSYEQTECGYGNCDPQYPWDWRNVDVSTDGGTTWDPVWGSKGPEDGWYQAWANLLPYVGGPLRVRFRFDTVDSISNAYFGWMVDNVAIVGCAPPDISVDAPPLQAELCPGGLVTTTLRTCNKGGAPLTWDLLEMSGTLKLAGWEPTASEPLAPSNAAPAGYLPRLTRSESRNLDSIGETVCVFKDVNPWGVTDVEDFLAAQGIPYEVHTSAEFSTLDFSQFGMIVFSGDQSQSFYDAYALNVAKFEDYVNAGGFLNFFSCDNGWNGGLLGAPLPGGMQWNTGFFETYNIIDDPAHPVVQGVPSPFYGSFASHGHFSNLPAGAHIIARGFSGNEPTIVEYGLGAGQVIALGQPLEISHNWGWDAGRILVNTLRWGYSTPLIDIPWLSETPTSTVVLPGECATVTVGFDATAIAPGAYQAGLLLWSDDPDMPTVTLPVSLTVLDPADDAAFDWTPLTPTVGLVVTFTGAATGTAPISFTWDLGEGNPVSGQSITHTYAAAGDYTVVMTATNVCGAYPVQHTLTVSTGRYWIYLPLILKHRVSP